MYLPMKVDCCNKHHCEPDPVVYLLNMLFQIQKVPNDASQAHSPYRILQGETPYVDQQPCSEFSSTTNLKNSGV